MRDSTGREIKVGDKVKHTYPPELTTFVTTGTVLRDMEDGTVLVKRWEKYKRGAESNYTLETKEIMMPYLPELLVVVDE